MIAPLSGPRPIPLDRPFGLRIQRVGVLVFLLFFVFLYSGLDSSQGADWKWRCGG